MNKIEKLGGIENFCNSINLKKYDIIRFEAISEAIIIINNKNGSRTSISTWGEYEHLNKISFPKDLSWMHFMYLDKLINLDENLFIQLKNNNVTISIDLCCSKHGINDIKKLNNLFKYVDFIFCSDIESKDIIHIINKSKNYVIHSPNKIILNGIHINNKKYKKQVINTLGAGDHFASIAVQEILSGKDFTNSCIIAMNKTSRYVKRGISE